MALTVVGNVVVAWRNDTQDVIVTWNASTDPGVTGYNIYRRPVPYGFTTADLVNTTALIPTNSYTETPPMILNNEWYYVVTAKTATQESPFQTEGVTWLPYSAFTDQVDINFPYLPDNDTMGFYFEEIRRRHTWMLINDGEDITFYKRRWSGPRCSCVQEQGEEGNYNHLECFGTGIKGGYYPGYIIKVRYGDMPQDLVRYQEAGLMVTHVPPSWTLWTPKLSEHDLIVRANGQRFDVNDISHSELRGLPLHQNFNMEEIVLTDIRYYVTDAAIAAALAM